MLDPDEDVFPSNIVKFTAAAMQGIDADLFVTKRALRNTDPMQSVGVFAQAWAPNVESIEMQNIGNLGAPQLPTLQEYIIGVQAFVKDSEEERGLATHAALAAATRSVLYTNTALQVIFNDLSATLDGGWIESMRRWGVRTARYFSGDVAGQMLYLSTLEFWIETETRKS